MNDNFNSFKQKVPGGWHYGKEYNKAVVNKIIEEYKFRAEYTTSDDFGVYGRKDINGRYASGYDRQAWMAKVSRRMTPIEAAYESGFGERVDGKVDHGRNKLKFGFSNPVFFEGDQRSTGGACFGKNTKIQLKSGKKVNIQIDNYEFTKF